MEAYETICKRGRPREFDVDAALDAAVAVFWRNGYDGTSLTDLTEAMGINRPSLYAAFGNKESLFRRAMDRYAERPRAMMAACEAEPTARGFTERLLRATVDGATDCRGPTGCFLIQGAMKCGSAADPLRQEAVDRRSEMETLLRARFERAVGDGELPPTQCPADLARYFAVLAQGMALRAADGADRAALHRVVDLALRAWPSRAGSGG
jgi:AcrR family transcriptional regulator